MSETAIVTLLFTDLVGSTELSQRLGEDASELLRQTHFALLEDAVAAHRGRTVKNLGDGLMVAFHGASDAIAASVVMQQAVERHNRSADEQLGLRVGLHAGEVTRDAGDYFGTPVVVAERLCKCAGAGQILASDMVRALVGTRGGSEFRSVGDLDLKGIADPVAAVEVCWEPERVTTAVPLPAALASADRLGFVGRDDEREEVERAVKLSFGGQRQVVLISGEPGIGKTRLATEVALSAHGVGAVVLYGRCDEDLGIPYQPFAEALRDYVAACPDDVLQSHVETHGAEIARLAPELTRRIPGLTVPEASASIDPQGDRDAERYRLFEAVADFLAAACERSAVLFLLDDLHWAARPTLLLLRHVLRRTTESALCIVGTYRDTDLDRTHPLAEMLADLRREPGTRRVSLGGLDESGVLALMQTMAGAELGDDALPLARALHAETEGNPFFVGEVLRHLAETGAIYQDGGRWTSHASIESLGIPEGVREVIGRRLSRLSQGANRALAVAAVAGPEFDLALLEQVPDAGEPDGVLDALDEATRARLVDEVPGPGVRYRFTHALVRQTLYDEMSSARRARLHRRVGEAIERRAGADLTVHLPALARHFTEAARSGEVTKGADYALAAGRQGLARCAYEEAADHGRRGLQVLDLDDEPHHELRADLHLMICEGVAWLADMQAAGQEALRSADEARAAGSADKLAWAAFWFGGTVFVSAPDQVIALCREALEVLPQDSASLRSLVTGMLAAVSGGRVSADEVDELAADAVRLAKVAGDDYALGFALFARAGSVRAKPGPVELWPAQELMDLADSSDDRMWRAQAVRTRGPVRLARGDRGGFEEDLAEFERLAAELRATFFVGLTVGWRELLAAMDGRFEDALALIARSAELNPAPTAEVVRIARRSWLRREQGEFVRVRELLEPMVELFPSTTGWHAALVATHAVAGDLDEARRGLEVLAQDDFAWRHRGHGISPYVYLAETCATIDDTAHAPRIYELLLPWAGQLGVQGDFLCPGAMDRFLGMVAATLARYDDAERHFDVALGFETRVRALPLVARTRYWYGRMLIRRNGAGDGERGRTMLEQCAATAAELGMAHLARIATDELGR